jgi:hypothetical protein
MSPITRRQPDTASSRQVFGNKQSFGNQKRLRKVDKRRFSSVVGKHFERPIKRPTPRHCCSRPGEQPLQWNSHTVKHHSSKALSPTQPSTQYNDLINRGNLNMGNEQRNALGKP